MSRSADQTNVLSVLHGIATALPGKPPPKRARNKAGHGDSKESWASQLRDCAAQVPGGAGDPAWHSISMVATQMGTLTRWRVKATRKMWADVLTTALQFLEKEWPMADDTPKLGWPLEGGAEAHPITRSAAEHVAFGERPAVDLAGPQSPIGTLCVASFDGVVRFSGYDPAPQYSAGWFVEVEGDVGGHRARHHGFLPHGDAGRWRAAGGGRR